MSYYLIVEDEEDLIASIYGWKVFKEETEGQQGDTLKEFISNGITDDVAGLSNDLDQLVDLSPESKAIYNAMNKTLGDNDGPAVLTDGTTSEDVEDDWHISEWHT